MGRIRNWRAWSATGTNFAVLGYMAVQKSLR
jgi:hypothetical protein